MALLDLSNRERVLQALRTLVDEGVTPIFTTHDPNAAALVADYVVLLRQGQVAAANLNAENLSIMARPWKCRDDWW